MPTLGLSVSLAPVFAIADAPIAPEPFEPLVSAPLMRCATIIAAAAVPESVAVICPVDGLADMPRQTLSVHWFCGDCRSSTTLANVMPLPDIELTVTPERHATQTRMRSFALGVHDEALMLDTLVPEPVTVAAVLIATA